MKNLKSLLPSLFIISFFMMMTTTLLAQEKKVNEKCDNDGECASGLKCVQRRDGTKVCAECDQSRLNTLSERVDRACKDEDKMSGAIRNQGDMNMDEIETKIQICRDCIAARKEVLSDCFRSNPDPDHVKALNDWQTSLENNIKIKDEKTTYRGAYYCSKSDYENYLRYIDNYCSKNFQQALDDANRKKQEKGGCSDLESWARSCEECVNNYNEFKRNAFRGQMSGKREEELGKYANALQGLKELRDYKKSNNLCE
jgi:hypothetical protein